MNAQELVESGIIELYVLGIASTEECNLIEAHVKEDIVASEIRAVNEALSAYAMSAGSIAQKPEVRSRIFKSIESLTLPPELTATSTVDEWLNYLEVQQVKPPQDFKGIYFHELPGNKEYYTYAVWGKNGDRVPQEVHKHLNEYLFVCSGSCEMTIDGKVSKHKRGDFIEIVPGVLHSGKVFGSEMMLVIGQRRAA